MAKSGFVPAWMKIPSADKTTTNQKFTFNRTTPSTILSTRQRHHSSDTVDQSSFRPTPEHFLSFPFRSSSNSNSADLTFKNHHENLSRTLESNRFLARKERLLSTPTHFEQSGTNQNLANNPARKTSSHPLTKQTIRLLSVPETSEEKDLLLRMGWNDEMTYEITEKDKEDYEKQMKLFPKINDQSEKLITALNRRKLPCMNIQEILQLEKIDPTSDDDDDDVLDE